MDLIFFVFVLELMDTDLQAFVKVAGRTCLETSCYVLGSHKPHCFALSKQAYSIRKPRCGASTSQVRPFHFDFGSAYEKDPTSESFTTLVGDFLDEHMFNDPNTLPHAFKQDKKWGHMGICLLFTLRLIQGLCTGGEISAAPGSKEQSVAYGRGPCPVPGNSR